MAFNGLGLHLGNLSRLSDAESRSISPENPTGERGKGAMAIPDSRDQSRARARARDGRSRPTSSSRRARPATLADIAGSGAIQQIWMTPTGAWRDSILRFYWDGADAPSVECPVGDFFACGWNKYAQVSSLAVCVNPGSAFNCYWEMPFRKSCRITMTNRAEAPMILYYQINYTLTEVPERRRLLSRAVPPRQSAPLWRGLHHPRWRSRARPLRRHLHGVGREQHRMVGRGRGEILTSTATASSRPSAAPAPRIISAAPTTSMSARRTAAIANSPRPMRGWRR